MESTQARRGVLARSLFGTGRGLAAGGRGLWRVVRGTATPGVRAVRAWRTAGPGRRHALLIGLSWLAALGTFGIAFGTGPQTFDVGRIGWGLMPFVGLATAVPLALVVFRPLLGLLLSVAGAAGLSLLLPLQPGLDWNWPVIHGLVMFVLLFVTCVTSRLRAAVGAWLLTAALWGWGVAPELRTGWLVGITIIAVLGLLVGRLTATRRALARQQEATSAEKSQRILLQERARIARDLHDIVAHHMSLVVVQAETAQYRVPDLPDAARAELTSISETARSALTQTRALLAVLRSEDDAAEHAPQPGLGQLPELVDSARRAGVRLETEMPVDSPEVRLEPGVSLAGYRIVQEALANASRHAPGSTVWLRRTDTSAEVRLSVLNGPGGERPGPEGHGITGMRERAAAAGARLGLGPTADGGFEVSVVLPVSRLGAVDQVSPQQQPAGAQG